MVRDTGNCQPSAASNLTFTTHEETNLQFYKNAALVVLMLGAILLCGVIFMPEFNQTGGAITCQHQP